MVRIRFKSFSLIELMIVMVVITILTSASFFAVRKSFRESHLNSTNQMINNFIKTARYKAKSHLIDYGVLFYINPENGRQHMAIIKAKTAPQYPYPSTGQEKYPDVCDRYEIDKDRIHIMQFIDIVRVAPINIFDWEDEDIENDNYFIPNSDDEYKHKNFFVIIVKPNGELRFSQTIIYDIKKEDGTNSNVDGIGELTGLVVGKTESEAGGDIYNIVKGNDDNRIVFPAARGVIIYDDTEMRELPSILWLEYLKSQDERILMLTQTESVKGGRS